MCYFSLQHSRAAASLWALLYKLPSQASGTQPTGRLQLHELSLGDVSKHLLKLLTGQQQTKYYSTQFQCGEPMSLLELCTDHR